MAECYRAILKDTDGMITIADRGLEVKMSKRHYAFSVLKESGTNKLLHMFLVALGYLQSEKKNQKNKRCGDVLLPL